MNIDATVDGRAAGSTIWDVTVVGAGPAGAATAHHLAQRGCRVLIADRASFPRTKVCGGCLSAKTLKELGNAGLLEAVRELGGLRLDTVRLGGWRRRIDIAIPVGMSLSRRAFDAALLRAAVGAGAHFIDRSRAALGASTDALRTLKLERDGAVHSIRSRVVIDASGLGGRLARAAVDDHTDHAGHPDRTAHTVQIGRNGRDLVRRTDPAGSAGCADRIDPVGRADPVERTDPAGPAGSAGRAGRINPVGHTDPVSRTDSLGRTGRVGVGTVVNVGGNGYESGTIHMAVGRYGYVGLVRLEDQSLNVAASLDVAAMRRVGTAAAVAEILAEAGFRPLPELDRAAWSGTPQLGFTPPRRGARRLFVVGDAAGYVEPFTGEGMGWALAAAALLAPIAAGAAADWPADAADAWEATYQRHILPSQRRCRIIAGGLRRPRLARPLLLLLAAIPSLASPLAQALHGTTHGEVESGARA